jgi:hypothetical protein
MLNFLKEFSHSGDESKKKNEQKSTETQGLKEILPQEESKKNQDVEGLTTGIASVDLKEKKVQVETVEEPAIIEKEVEAPVVKEKIIPQVQEVVQPVIVRDTERTEVHHIIQPLSNKEVLPTKVVQAELPVTTIPDTVEKPKEGDVSKYYEAHNREADSTKIMEPQVKRTVLPPIVKERITPVIHEEVQPVIYQETIQPVVITENQPFYHKIVEAPKVVEEVRPMKSLDDARALLEKIGTTTIKTESAGQGSATKKEGGQQ